MGFITAAGGCAVKAFRLITVHLEDRAHSVGHGAYNKNARPQCLPFPGSAGYFSQTACDNTSKKWLLQAHEVWHPHIGRHERFRGGLGFSLAWVYSLVLRAGGGV
jgi:hypothetical protein